MIIISHAYQFILILHVAFVIFTFHACFVLSAIPVRFAASQFTMHNMYHLDPGDHAFQEWKWQLLEVDEAAGLPSTNGETDKKTLLPSRTTAFALVDVWYRPCK